MQPPRFIKCIHCDYTWYTKSILRMITCPNCGGKTPTPLREEPAEKVTE